MTARILVVEDEKAIGLALSGLLRKVGYDVVVISTAESAIAALEADNFDLVLTDLSLGRGQTGMDVLACAKRTRREMPVVMITAHGSEKVAVEAIKAGAEDYVPKPFDNDEIRLVVSRALDRTRLAREYRMLLDRVEREFGFGSLIGSGPAMKRVFETIQRVAETDLTVLIRGESGSGKELVAQALHGRSSRADRPFIAVNCAAISRELVESELFGHEKGAFTGADSRRIGRFEAAHGGTIFLDEIGDMPLETQAKVLRVLQERTLERVGGNTSIPIDVRVVAATHRDLELEVANNRYREDLYYRLKVVQCVLPPLRDRTEDIPALAQRFMGQLAARLGRDPKPLDDEALAQLVRHGWPGNVRELKNVIERAFVMAEGPHIDKSDLDLDSSERGASRIGPIPGVSFAEAKKEAVRAFERAYLNDALAQNDDNISRCADAIGMVRQSLQHKLRELGLRGSKAED
jgi:DNA-binding NtrC family response regulator